MRAIVREGTATAVKKQRTMAVGAVAQVKNLSPEEIAEAMRPQVPGDCPGA